MLDKTRSYIFDNFESRIEFLDHLGICWADGSKASERPLLLRVSSLEVSWSGILHRWTLFSTAEEPIVLDWEVFRLNAEMQTEEPTLCINHEWVDTGGKKTWCKHCDADGWEGVAV